MLVAVLQPSPAARDRVSNGQGQCTTSIVSLTGDVSRFGIWAVFFQTKPDFAYLFLSVRFMCEWKTKKGPEEPCDS